MEMMLNELNSNGVKVFSSSGELKIINTDSQNNHHIMCCRSVDNQDN